MSEKCLFVPIDINSRQYLPKVTDRPYTKFEALFSVQLDHFNKNSVSVSGYARLWQWSRNKVRKFMDNIGVDIELDQIKKRTGEGQQKDRRGTAKGQISFIDLRHLEDDKDSKKTGKGRQKDSGKDTTKKRVIENREKNNITKPENVTDQTWNDFLTHRKSKKAPVTQTVINTFIKQAELAGMTIEDAIIKTINKNWVGFNAKWVNKNLKNNENSNKNFLDGVDLNGIN